MLLLLIFIRKNPADKCKIFKEISKTSAKYSKKLEEERNIKKERNVINLKFICDQVHNKVGRDGRLCDQV